MRAIFICLLPGIFLSVVSFSQTDTADKKNYAVLFQPNHFNNPFYKLPATSTASPVYFSFLRGSELHVTSRTSFNNGGYPAYPNNMPIWKELMSLAGQIMIQSYQDNRNSLHFYPR